MNHDTQTMNTMTPANRESSKLCDAILREIQVGNRTFRALCDALESLEKSYIVIDRQLEELRKAKKIAYSPHGWRVTRQRMKAVVSDGDF